MNKNIRSILLIVVVIIVFDGLYFFYSQPPEDNNSRLVTIGVSLPFTGKSASFGERLKIATDLSVVSANKKNKIPVRVIYDDDKGEPTAAVSVINKFIFTDKVKIIIGTVKSDPMLAVAPIAEKNKVILFSPTAGAVAISQAGDFIFRNIEVPAAHGVGATEFFQKNNIKRVALFTAQAANAISYSQAFKENFTNSGGSIVISTDYQPDAMDFRTEIAKARSSGAEAFYAGIATARDAGILVKQIRESGFKGLVMVSVAAEAPEFFTTAGAFADGTYLTASPIDYNSSEAQNYFEQYAKLYGSTSDGFAANAYDALQLVAAAVNSCDSDSDTQCIRDYLYNVKDYPGVGGITTFDHNGDVIKRVIIKVARDGQFTPVQ